MVHSSAQHNQQRAERIQRLRQMHLDSTRLSAYIGAFRGCSREQLVAGGYLVRDLPSKGTTILSPRHRTERGNRLLQDSKDILYGLLFGDEAAAVRFDRVQRELLTMTVPRSKVRFIEFMQASTELKGAGTWQDPENVASDERADNVIVEVEYGEASDESIGHGIVTALRLINLLEINEQLLYARMTDIEQSTLSAPNEETSHEGTWKIESASVAPWWASATPPDSGYVKQLSGKSVIFGAKQIVAPGLLACRAPRYTWKQYPADMLFQGMLGEMARRDSQVQPARLAAALGFSGERWKTLETGCVHAIDFHFIDARNAAFALDNYIFRLKKQ